MSISNIQELMHRAAMGEEVSEEELKKTVTSAKTERDNLISMFMTDEQQADDLNSLKETRQELEKIEALEEQGVQLGKTLLDDLKSFTKMLEGEGEGDVNDDQIFNAAHKLKKTFDLYWSLEILNEAKEMDKKDEESSEQQSLNLTSLPKIGDVSNRVPTSTPSRFIQVEDDIYLAVDKIVTVELVDHPRDDTWAVRLVTGCLMNSLSPNDYHIWFDTRQEARSFVREHISSELF